MDLLCVCVCVLHLGQVELAPTLTVSRLGGQISGRETKHRELFILFFLRAFSFLSEEVCSVNSEVFLMYFFYPSFLSRALKTYGVGLCKTPDLRPSPSMLFVSVRLCVLVIMSLGCPHI